MLLVIEVPTAQMSFLETAATPLSTLEFNPALGLETTLQDPQFDDTVVAVTVPGITVSSKTTIT